MYDLIVIGAGPGGYEAAAHAAKMGKKTLLFEKSALGGTCLNVGCIPTKTFLKSSHLLSECREAENYGISVSAPKLNFNSLQARKQRVIDTLKRGVASMLKRSKVEVIQAPARITAKGTVEAEGKSFQAANILIATGSTPAVPPIPGIDSPAVLDSTGALVLDRQPESAVIIGGGVIGLEFACFFNEIGVDVTVVEMLSDVGMGLDADIAQELKTQLENKGIKFNLGCMVTEIENTTVHFKAAEDKHQTVTGEVILNATGRKPVTEGLGLEEAGVDAGPQGIVTSEEGKTNIPGIWACGDVTGRCLLAHAATREGIVAVNNMFGSKDRIRYSAIPGVIYTHPEVAMVGRTEAQLVEDGVEYIKSVRPMTIAGRYVVENEAQDGMVKILAGKQYGEILGVHMLGQGCSEHIFGAALMMETQMCVADIQEVVFPHPTVSEALKETVNHFGPIGQSVQQ